MKKICMKFIWVFAILNLVIVSSSITSKTIAEEVNYNELNAELKKLDLESDGIEFITDTDNNSEYLLNVEGETLRYQETTKTLGNGAVMVTTKIYNDKSGKLLSKTKTKIKGDKIIKQDYEEYEALPMKETQVTQEPTKSKDLFYAYSYSSSNRSLVTPLGIRYYTNYSTNKGYATYANLRTKTVNIKYSSYTNRSNYDKFTRAVDSMRGHENGTIAGWLISGFSGGGLTVGALLSWSTVKVILKNIAGPVAVVANAYALTMWVYYYNKVGQSYYAIK